MEFLLGQVTNDLTKHVLRLRWFRPQPFMTGRANLRQTQFGRSVSFRRSPRKKQSKLKVLSFRIASYNIHKCIGLDRCVRPMRIAQVLKQISADIIALQEVVDMDKEALERNQVRAIADELGVDFRIGENRRQRPVAESLFAFHCPAGTCSSQTNTPLYHVGSAFLRRM